jgi:hypothetical protein
MCERKFKRRERRTGAVLQPFKGENRAKPPPSERNRDRLDVPARSERSPDPLAPHHTLVSIAHLLLRRDGEFLHRFANDLVRLGGFRHEHELGEVAEFDSLVEERAGDAVERAGDTTNCAEKGGSFGGRRRVDVAVRLLRRTVRILDPRFYDLAPQLGREVGRRNGEGEMRELRRWREGGGGVDGSAAVLLLEERRAAETAQGHHPGEAHRVHRSHFGEVKWRREREGRGG